MRANHELISPEKYAITTITCSYGAVVFLTDGILDLLKYREINNHINNYHIYGFDVTENSNLQRVRQEVLFRGTTSIAAGMLSLATAAVYVFNYVPDTEWLKEK